MKSIVKYCMNDSILEGTEEKIEETSIIKEPEMFDETESEEDFEIPAFLRKQKN